MRVKIGQTLVLLAAVLASGCRPSEQAVDPPASAAAPSEASAAAEPTETAAQPVGVASPPGALDEPIEVSQARIAADLQQALDTGDGAAAQVALQTLGRHLGEYRGRLYGPAFVAAVRRFASAEAAPARRDVDARYVIPALEVLLDLRDAAAIDRLAADYGAGPVADRFEAARRHARNAAPDDARLDVVVTESGCELIVDGEPWGEGRAVLPGSHTARCGDRPARAFSLSTRRTILVSAEDVAFDAETE